MSVIQIGSLSILLKWVILGIAVLAGLVFVKIWLKGTQEKETHKKIFDIVSNGIFIGFISWKASLLLLEPQLVIRSPLSLLYFTGGSKGLLLAIIITILYVLFSFRKMHLPELLNIQIILFLNLVVVGSYQILAAILLSSDTTYHLVLGVGTIAIFLFSFIRKLTLIGLYYVIILWSFSAVVLQFLFLPTSAEFLFTLEQWFYIGLILTSLFYINKRLQHR